MEVGVMDAPHAGMRAGAKSRAVESTVEGSETARGGVGHTQHEHDHMGYCPSHPCWFHLDTAADVDGFLEWRKLLVTHAHVLHGHYSLQWPTHGRNGHPLTLHYTLTRGDFVLPEPSS
jgi:hypothetical protein